MCVLKGPYIEEKQQLCILINSFLTAKVDVFYPLMKDKLNSYKVSEIENRCSYLADQNRERP